MVSDLHNKVYGKDNDKVIRKIEQANPDFILIVGDLVTSHQDEPVDTGIQFVNGLSGKYRIYYSPGNHESKLKYRADYYHYYTGHEWFDARNYDLCLDSSKLGFEKCVEEIKSYIAIRTKQ